MFNTHIDEIHSLAEVAVLIDAVLTFELSDSFVQFISWVMYNITRKE